jgi:hypothetical protein
MAELFDAVAHQHHPDRLARDVWGYVSAPVTGSA